MKKKTLQCGFVPLVDSAPLIIASELDFAKEEGITLNLLRQPSWSAMRDLLALGHLDVAHMLSPMPIAMSLGLGSMSAQVDALMVLSGNGNVIGASTALAAKMRANGWSGAFDTPVETGQALIESAEGPVRIGVPFPFSMHTELLHYWLSGFGEGAFKIVTIPPPMMAEAIANDEVDAFCVGEPWGSIAVEDQVGELILPGSAIWAFAPEKVLGARREWIEENPTETAAVMRAVYRASAWLSSESNRSLASEVLARSEHLGLPDHIIDRALAGRLIQSPRSMAVDVPHFLRFHEGAAHFPWRSQAAWIATQMKNRLGLVGDDTIEIARGCFRSDLYRQNLSHVTDQMPPSSDKIEGSLETSTPVPAMVGQMSLGPDAFFDGSVFDLTSPE